MTVPASKRWSPLDSRSHEWLVEVLEALLGRLGLTPGHIAQVVEGQLEAALQVPDRAPRLRQLLRECSAGLDHLRCEVRSRQRAVRQWIAREQDLECVATTARDELRAHFGMLNTRPARAAGGKRAR